MYGLIDVLYEQWDRTIQNCEFYEKEKKDWSLIEKQQKMKEGE